MEKYFLTNSSFRLVETDFLSRGKGFFQSFIESFVIRRWHILLVETDVLASGNNFFCFSDTLLVKVIFCLVEAHFETNLPIRMVKTHFTSCGNRFLLINLFFNKLKPSLKLVGTHYFGVKILFSPAERDFLFNENCFFFILCFFPASENRY